MLGWFCVVSLTRVCFVLRHIPFPNAYVRRDGLDVGLP
jgi:hypothetical protein